MLETPVNACPSRHPQVCLMLYLGPVRIVQLYNIPLQGQGQVSYIIHVKHRLISEVCTGIFSPRAETTNGRAAMLGFGILLLLEANSQVPFF